MGAGVVVRRPAPVLALIIVAGLLLRALPWFRPHALLGVLEHDDGIYYGAATLLLHGQLPYADVAFVHPPGVVLLLVPFAALGALVGDPLGLAAARVAVLLVAAANTYLVFRLVRRLPAAPGRATAAALLAAALYAASPPAVLAERTVLLEPLVTLPCLLAVLLLGRAESHRTLAAIGGLLAVGLSVKAFAGAYLVVIVGLLLLTRGARSLRWLAAGLAAGTAVLVLPLALAAPGAFWQQVVVTQLARPAGSGPARPARLLELVGLGTVPLALGVLLLVLVVAELARQATREAARPIRLWLALAGLSVVAFVGAASFFPHYGAFLTPALAVLLTRGVAVPMGRSAWNRARAGLLASLLVAFVASSVHSGLRSGEQGDLAALGRRIPAGSCVFYESASVALATGHLDPPSARCPAWLDARGLLYSRSTDWPAGRDFFFEGFTSNQWWQEGVRQQLRHADHLLIKAPPEQIPEWSAQTRALALERFRQVAVLPGTGHARVELWSRKG